MGTEVRDRTHAQADDAAVRVERHLRVGDVVAAVRVGHEALASLGRPPHGALERSRDPGDRDFLGVDEDLRPEAAADVRRDDAELVLGKSEHERAHDQAVDVRVLRCHPQRQLVGRPRVRGERSAGLDGDRDEPLVHQPLPNDGRRLRERRVGRGRVPDLPAKADVVGSITAHDRCVRCQRLFGVGHRRKRLVVHHYQLGGIAGGVRRLRDNHGDRLAGVVHLLDGNRVVVARLELRQEPSRGNAVHTALGEVLSGVDGYYAGVRSRGVQVDRANARVRVRAPDERRVQRPRYSHVIGVLAAPGEEPRILLAADAGSERPFDAVCCTAICAGTGRGLIAGGGGRRRGHGRGSSACGAARHLDLGAGG